MPNFKYKALTATGAKVEGVMTVDTKDEVVEALRKNKEFPIQIDEVIEGATKISILDTFSKVKSKDLSIFCRQFYTMLNAGVTIITCLDILRAQTNNKKLKFAISEMYEDVQKGRLLSESMAGKNDIFPEILINMIGSGEVSGTLDVIMERMAIHFEKENRIVNKVKSAMVYPAVLGCVALGVVIFLMAFVVPNFVAMFQSSGVELPLPTRIMLSISHAVKKYGIFMLMGIIGIIYGLNRLAKTEEGKIYVDRLRLKIPVVKHTTQMMYTSRFTRTLATLLASGIPLIQALEIVAKVSGNKLVEQGIIASIEEVKKGVSLSIPIKNLNLFPPMVYHMISIGEESGALDDILERTATFYDEELDGSIQRLISFMEPAMILVMALIAGSIVISIVLPMFDMMKTVA